MRGIWSNCGQFNDLPKYCNLMEVTSAGMSLRIFISVSLFLCIGRALGKRGYLMIIRDNFD